MENDLKACILVRISIPKWVHTLPSGGPIHFVIYIGASIFIKVHLVWAMAADVWSFTHSNTRSHSFSLIYLSLCECVCVCYTYPPHITFLQSHFTHLLAHHVQQIIIYRSWLCCAHTCYMWMWINMLLWFGLAQRGLVAPFLCSISLLYNIFCCSLFHPSHLLSLSFFPYFSSSFSYNKIRTALQ